MEVGFIAGPYIGDGTPEVVERNIADAEKVAIELANRGIPFFCPHTHTRHFQTKAKAPESFYKALDRWYLDKSNYLIEPYPNGVSRAAQKTKWLSAEKIKSWFSFCGRLMIKQLTMQLKST